MAYTGRIVLSGYCILKILPGAGADKNGLPICISGPKQHFFLYMPQKIVQHNAQVT